MSTQPAIKTLSCSIFKSEIEHLSSHGMLNLDIEYLDSSLHMSPMKLCQIITDRVGELTKSGFNVLLIYGDCHPYMLDISRQKNVARTKASSCVEMLLGKNEYKKLMRDGAFVLLPEWTLRWKDILLHICGCEGHAAVNLMQGLHNKLVFLDTGTCLVPNKSINECSDFFGMPCEIKKITLDEFLRTIQLALNELIAKNE